VNNKGKPVRKPESSSQVISEQEPLSAEQEPDSQVTEDKSYETEQMRDKYKNAQPINIPLCPCCNTPWKINNVTGKVTTPGCGCSLHQINACGRCCKCSLHCTCITKKRNPEVANADK